MMGRAGIGFPRHFSFGPGGFRLSPRSQLTRLLPPLVLLSLCLLLFFQGIGTRELWASHEARAAQNAQRMLDDGNWLLPRLYDGQVELQKPPGYYWLVALVGRLWGGVDAFAVRMPAAAAGVLTVLLVWWHLWRRGRPVAGFVAGALLAGAVHFTGTARIGRIDVPLTCAVTAIMLIARDIPPERVRVYVVTGVIGGGALLLKGPIGVVLPAVALGIWWTTERVPVRRMFVPAMIAGVVALAVALPWFVWVNMETDGELFRVFFVHHHVNRAFGGAEALAAHPWWYYLPRFAADFLPWTPLLVVALVWYRWRSDIDAGFGLVWLVVMILLLSLSQFKRADYLLPAYPGAAILVGCAIESWYLARSSRARLRGACAIVLTLTLLPMGWLIFDRLVTAPEGATREQSRFASLIRETSPAPELVILFRVESHLLAYHLGRPVHTLVEWGDLNARLRESGPHTVVTRAEFLDECRQNIAVPFEVVARNEDVSPAHPHRPLVVLRTVTEACPTPPRD
jgi:4-amino-4-deoxy-L-arabinose transferase-like glycosyltransferase